MLMLDILPQAETLRVPHCGAYHRPPDGILLGTLVPNYICLKFLFKLWHYLLAPPSGALEVSQFQDPARPIPSHPTYRFGCSKLCSNVPD